MIARVISWSVANRTFVILATILWIAVAGTYIKRTAVDAIPDLSDVQVIVKTSYPGQALMTEDQGILMHRDGCPCGRQGLAFRFTRRVERTIVRGCGDTFAQKRTAS